MSGAEKILTIGVPAYNMQDYIAQTLDSFLCGECLKDVEVIVVDDGSSDNTFNIAKKYQNQYPESFIVVHQNNGGHGEALNTAIKHATGKYFRPVDSDDWLDTESLIKFIGILKNKDADMVLTNFEKIYEKQGRKSKIRLQNVWNRKEIEDGKANVKPGRKKLIYEKVYDFEKELFDFYKQYLFHQITYRTSILKDNDIIFDKHVSYDDIEYNTFPIPFVKTVLPIDIYLYQYRLDREGQSVDQSVFARKHRDRRIVVEHVIQYCNENKDKFSPNVYEHICEENRYRIKRQFEIYFDICTPCEEIKREVLEFASSIKRIDKELYKSSINKRTSLVVNSKGALYRLATNKDLIDMCGAITNWETPYDGAATWSIASDLPMHRAILKRTILKYTGLWLFNSKMKSIRRLKNIHNGDRIFITCPGPSMKLEDLDLLADEYTFGVNSITKAYDRTEWRPTYYALIDYRSFGKTLNKQDVPGRRFAKEQSFFHYRCNPKSKGGEQIYIPINYSNHKKSWMRKKKIKYSNDISVCVYDGFTVTNMAIQIALYMGFKEIYLVGADCDYSGNQIHFIEAPGDKQKIAEGWLPDAARLSLDGYEAIKPYARKKHTNIYNATRGGKLESFPRVNLDDVVKEKLN